MKVEVNGHTFDTDAVLITLDDGRTIEFGPEWITAYESSPSDGNLTETESLFGEE